MKPSLLFPPLFRIVGLILLLPGLVFALIFLDSRQHIGGSTGSDSFIDEIAATLLVTGLFFIGFSKLKNENDQINMVRLSALYWSTLINCGFFIFFFIFDSLESRLKNIYLFFDLLRFIVDYNVFLFLFLFVITFYFSLFRSKKGKIIKPLYLLPYLPYTVVAKIFVVFFIFACILSLNFKAVDNLLKFMHESTFALFPFCLLIWLWSKQKSEEESVKNIRLKSMQLAVYICYGLVVVLTWLVYGFDYLGVLYFGFLGLLVIFFIVFYSHLQLEKRRGRFSNLQVSGTKP